MSDSIALGPLVLPTQALLLLAATALALGVLHLLPETQRSTRARAEARLFLALLAGILGARLGWIARHWQAYADSPGSILAFRDGGYSPTAGLLVACALIAVFLWRTRFSIAVKAAAEGEDCAGSARAEQVLSRRQLLVPAVVGFLVVLAGQWLLTANRSDAPVPVLEVLTLSGEVVRMPGARGRPQVINLWASWCAPCRREMPAFMNVQQQRPDVDFVYLNIGESRQEIELFTRTLAAAPAPILRDPEGRVAEAFEVRGYPTTLILDAEGRLLHRRTGELSEASLEALLPAAEAEIAAAR